METEKRSREDLEPDFVGFTFRQDADAAHAAIDTSNRLHDGGQERWPSENVPAPQSRERVVPPRST